MRSITALFLVISLALPAAADDDRPNLAVGTGFRSALEQPFSPSWDHIDLRGIVETIEAGSRVAILVDRRIDPNAERSLQGTTGTLRDCFDRLAAECDAGATVVGNVVYLGPRGTAGKLRTLVAIKKQELKDMQLPESRRTALNRGKPFHWSDLERPADLVQRGAAESRLDVEGLDQIPHDLWGAGVFPDATPFETLTLLLCQFDLTFQWTAQARGIRIEPIPDRVAIEKPHDPPRGISAADAITRWREEIPELEARASGNKVIVSGTEELHETIDRLRRGLRPNDKGPGNVAAQIPPLNLKRYNGKIANVTVSDLLRNLETPGMGMVTFEYDRSEFKAAGIDLEKRISIELKNDKIEDLLKKALDPLGVTFEIHERTVRLKPAKKG